MSYSGDDYDMGIGFAGLALIIGFPIILIAFLIWKLVELVVRLFTK